MRLDVKDLRFEVEDALHAEIFDDQTTHGLSHAFKAVDLLIEWATPLHPRRSGLQPGELATTHYPCHLRAGICRLTHQHKRTDQVTPSLFAVS